MQTERLSLAPLTIDDADFIRELVNTKGWLAFIGNRHVYSADDARAYTQKICTSASSLYWVVTLKSTLTPIGIITVIKRDYLPYHDIGFAFLPQYNGVGYAYEAAKAVLDQLRQQPIHACMLATTLPGNTTSIKLIEKLGLQFDKEIMVNDQLLCLYTTSKK